MNNLGFGDMLRAYRKKHHLTQRELAEKMNISSNHLSVLERDKKMPRTSTIETFEELLTEEIMEEYAKKRRLTDQERKEYLRLLNCLETMDEKKLSEVLNAIIALLNLM